MAEALNSRKLVASTLNKNKWTGDLNGNENDSYTLCSTTKLYLLPPCYHYGSLTPTEQ